MADPQQWNMYSYVRNNPLIYVDPDGKELSLWLFVKDQSSRQNVVKAAPKIANDFHRWGVKSVHVHITSDASKVKQAIAPKLKTGSNIIVVNYENSPSMTQWDVFGLHGHTSDTVTVNTGLTSWESSTRNVTDHEVTHEAQPFTQNNGISALLNLDHSSDPNDIMYNKYDTMNQRDPQMSQDEQKMVQDAFNQKGDKDEVVVVDEENKAKRPSKEKPQ